MAIQHAVLNWRTTFTNATRIQQSFTAPVERRALRWLAERTPARINSDHLTLLGFSAQFAAGADSGTSGRLTTWSIWALPPGSRPDGTVTSPSLTAVAALSPAVGEA